MTDCCNHGDELSGSTNFMKLLTICETITSCRRHCYMQLVG